MPVIPAHSIGVVYDPIVQEELLTTLIDCFISAFSADERIEQSRSLWLEVAQFIIHEIEHLIVAFKHSGFAEEQERRLYILTQDVNQVKLKERNGIFIPYTEIRPTQGAKLPIAEIIVAPTDDFERIEIGLRFLLGKTGYPSVAIRPSQTPYRTR